MPNTKNTTLTEFPSQTIATAAKVTGLSEITVRRHIANGVLPAYRIGRRIRIADSDLLSLYTPIPAYGVSHD